MDLAFNLHIGWPQGIYLGLMIFSFVVTSINHGEPKTGNWTIWDPIVTYSITLTLLYFGGFFTK